MRINNLQIKDFYHIKNSCIDIGKDENVIAVICKKDIRFTKTDFMYAMEQLFNGDMSMRSGEIMCACQKDDKKYFIELFAEKLEEKRIINGKEFSGKKIVRKQTCLCEETVSDKIKWFCGLDYKNWLYPTSFWDYGVFRGESMLDELVFGIEDGCLFEPTLEEDEENLIKALNKSINDLTSISIGGKELCIDRDGRICVKNGGYINAYTDNILSEEEKLLANFLLWLSTLNIIKQICKETDRLLGFPVFIENFFERLTDYSKIDMIFQSIRKAERQVFIILNERNALIESFCDKVFEIDKI